MNQFLNYGQSSVVPQLKSIVQFGVAIALLSGPALIPAHAEPLAVGANAIAANPPVVKPNLFVNPATGVDSATVGQSEATPFKTITYALQQVKPGMTIQVAPGTYSQETGETFPLVVPAGVTLQGDEANQGRAVAITGGSFYSSSWWGSQNIAILAKPDSQIIGLTVTNLNSRGTGIWLESSNAAVRGCTLTKNAREGVFAAGKSAPTLENNLFIDNSANGVALTGMTTGMIRNNTFQKTGFGIAVSEQAAPELVNNRVQNNVDGIVVSHSAAPQLRGNIVEDSQRDGLVAISKAHPNLGSGTAPGRNIFRNNGRFAIYNATLTNSMDIEGNDVIGKIQLTALGPTGVDSDAPPDVQAIAPNNIPNHGPNTAPNDPVSGATATPSISATTTSVKAPSKVDGAKTLDSAKLKQELSKAPTVQYKGKTYVLLENVMPLTR